MDVLKNRLSLLKSKLSVKGISVKNESLEWSVVQAALSRGDGKLANILAEMEKPSLAVPIAPGTVEMRDFIAAPYP